MSDLGAIFHVKKAGVQYNAHAYTTLDECPYPNLKIKFKGQQGYVKLVNNGEGDVPCYVKPKSENKIYQVRKEVVVVPHGSVSINGYGVFTVPTGITVIWVSHHDLGDVFVGVTPGTKHTLSIGWDMIRPGRYETYIGCESHNMRYIGDTISTGDREPSQFFNVRWSPTINTYEPDITDY